jgi:hypothetical protein
MPFSLFKSIRLIAYPTPQAVQPMGSTACGYLQSGLAGKFLEIDCV